MIKIFNTEMGIDFLKKNRKRKLFKCGFYDDVGVEVTLNELLEIKDVTSWKYQYFTEDLIGDEWLKYSELDLFNISRETKKEFLAIGFSRVINKLKNSISYLESSNNSLVYENKHILAEVTKLDITITKMLEAISKDCPKHIKLELEHQYNMEEDEYKCLFYIIPNTAMGDILKNSVKERAFIFEQTNVVEGWLGIYSIGD